MEATLGTARFRGRLDFLIDRHLRSAREIDPLVRDLLRLGAYELLLLSGAPDYAVVSQAVEQARSRMGEGASRLVNAVLRRVREGGMDPAFFPSRETDPAGHLSSWGSHPRWLVERWLTRWGPEETEALVEANNARPDLHLQPWGLSVEEMRSRLRDAGIEGEGVAGGPGLRLAPGSDPRLALEAVPAIVQDPAAALVVEYAAPPPGARIVDLCAAPGGKALALSRGAAYLLAGDPSLPRAALILEGARRLGAPVGVVVARGEEPPVREADFVLADVPCSGTGTLRRHPDARWRLRPEDLAALSAVQDGILDGAARIVRPGGILVYSTCTLEPEENEERVDAFLKRHPEFEADPGEGGRAPFVGNDGFLRVLPQSTRFDGAFAARLVRSM